MRSVIVVTTPGYSGGRRVASNLSIFCNVKLLYLLPHSNGYECDSLVLAKRGRFKYIDYIRSFFYLHRYVKRNNITNIVAEGLIPAVYTIIIKYLSFNHIKLTTRIGRDFDEQKFYYIWLVVYLSSDLVITPLKHNLSNKKLKFISNKLRHIPNPVLTLNSYNEQSTKSTNCIRNTLLVIGRAVPEKNLEMSIEFGAKIADKMGLRKILVTTGNSLYFKEIISLGKINGFEFQEYGKDISELYKESKVLINFAYGEGFSFITYEAASFGVPTISIPSTSGQNEMITEYRYGLIVDSISDFNAAIDYLSNHLHKPLVLDWNHCSTYFNW